MSITATIAAVAGRLHHAPRTIDVREPAPEHVVQDGLTGRYTARPSAQWLPFADLTACEQAARVGAHVEHLMGARHLTTWGLAEAAQTQQYSPTSQDVSDLLHGMRHLRGAGEVRALADALGVVPGALMEPGWFA